MITSMEKELILGRIRENIEENGVLIKDGDMGLFHGHE